MSVSGFQWIPIGSLFFIQMRSAVLLLHIHKLAYRTFCIFPNICYHYYSTRLCVCWCEKDIIKLSMIVHTHIKSILNSVRVSVYIYGKCIILLAAISFFFWAAGERKHFSIQNRFIDSQFNWNLINKRNLFSCACCVCVRACESAWVLVSNDFLAETLIRFACKLFS